MYPSNPKPIAQFEPYYIVRADWLEHPAFHHKEKGCRVVIYEHNISRCNVPVIKTLSIIRKGKIYSREVSIKHTPCGSCDFVTRSKCYTHNLQNICQCGFEFGHHCGTWNGVFRDEDFTIDEPSPQSN